MYQLICPKIVIPVHGETRHLIKHAEIALDCQVPETLVVRNGSVVRLAPNKAKVIDEVQAGRFAIDGSRIIPVESDVIKDRNRISYNGVVVLSLVLDHNNSIQQAPILTAHGLIENSEREEVLADVTIKIKDELLHMSEVDISDNLKISENIRIITRRYFREKYNKRPLTSVHNSSWHG